MRTWGGKQLVDVPHRLGRWTEPLSQRELLTQLEPFRAFDSKTFDQIEIFRVYE